MKTWDVFTTADQLRNAIRALFNPGEATATNTYLGFGTDNLPRWNTLPTATAIATATAADLSGLAKGWIMFSAATGAPLVTKASFGVATQVIYTSAGVYGINPVVFAASDYIGIGITSGSTSTNSTNQHFVQRDEGRAQTATLFPFLVQRPQTGILDDPAFVYMAFYGIT